MSKAPVTFRFGQQTIELIKRLADHLGINKTAVVALAIKHLASRHKID